MRRPLNGCERTMHGGKGGLTDCCRCAGGTKPGNHRPARLNPAVYLFLQQHVDSMKPIIHAFLIIMTTCTVIPYTFGATLTNDNAKLIWKRDPNGTQYGDPQDYTGDLWAYTTNTSDVGTVIDCGGVRMIHGGHYEVEHVNLHHCILVSGVSSTVTIDLLRYVRGITLSSFTAEATAPCSATVNDTVVDKMAPGAEQTVQLNVHDVNRGIILMQSDDISNAGTLDLNGKGEVTVTPGDGITLRGSQWEITGETPSVKVSTSLNASGVYTSNLTATLSCE